MRPPRVPAHSKAARNSRGVPLLLGARAIREIAFGFISLVLPLYWINQGLSIVSVGTLYTVALLGSSLITMGLARFVDQVGRRNILLFSSALWTVATPFLLWTTNPAWLVLVVLLGTISPTGKEMGPYLGIEQAILARLFGGHKRLSIYAWFNLVGYSATAVGALLAALLGFLPVFVIHGPVNRGLFQGIFLAYTLAGLVQFVLYAFLPRTVEMPRKQEIAVPARPHVPTLPVRRLVYGLSSLFLLDALAGGFVVQSLLVYWFRVRFGVDRMQLCQLLFGTNVLSGLSSLGATGIAKRFGLLNTMVFTHLPSNLLLGLVPLMPTPGWAVTVLLTRHILSQMDVPTRQSYTMAMVDSEYRGYVATWTNGVRSLGTAATPVLTGIMLAMSLTGLPFFLAGGTKIVYDLILWRIFRRVPINDSD
jgi:MFS family permease